MSVIRRRQRRDLVTLLLLDLSSSTDAWSKGHRVLDVAKESLLVLGEVLSSYRDQVGIGGGLQLYATGLSLRHPEGFCRAVAPM